MEQYKAYKDDGTTEFDEVISNDIEIEEKVRQIEKENTKTISKINKDEGSKLKSFVPLKVTKVEGDVDPIMIDSVEKFQEIKLDILKAQYIYLYSFKAELIIITDTGKYFKINTLVVEKDTISELFVYRKPKKVVFDIQEYKDYINYESVNFIDLKHLFNLNWGRNINGIKNLFKTIGLDYKSIKGDYPIGINLINIAREMNIYIESNKLNKRMYLELDNLLKKMLVTKKGLPIDIDRFNQYKNDVTKKFEVIEEAKVEKYGETFDFNNKSTVLNYLFEKRKVTSLEFSILKEEDSELYEDYTVYSEYKKFSNIKVRDNNIILDYKLQHPFKSHLRNEVSIQNDFVPKDICMVEGEYKDLYLRVLAELTKNKDLIIATSKNELREYINANILKKEGLGIYSEILIKAYANRKFTVKDIKAYALQFYNTIISESDVLYVEGLFKNNASSLYEFFVNFDSQDSLYEVYSKNLFQKKVGLDKLIEQICNMIFKDAVSYIDDTVKEYNKKYANKQAFSMELTAFYDDKIILTSTEDSKKIAVDILNRYMAMAYKKHIKKTKFYNTTKVYE